MLNGTTPEKFNTENEDLSGAPERIKNHAEKIIDMALDMKDCATFIQDPRLKENAGKSAKYNQKYRGPKYHINSASALV